MPESTCKKCGRDTTGRVFAHNVAGYCQYCAADRIVELEGIVEPLLALIAAGTNAIVVIECLADQQAMPDDSYQPGLADLVAALAAAQKAAEFAIEEARES